MTKSYDVDKYENFQTDVIKDSVDSFHKQRIAFMIIDDKVMYLANSKLSHIQWAEKLGISNKQFNNITRGYYLGENIVFYKGNFDFDKKVIEDAKKFAYIIKKDFNIKYAKVYVGLEPGPIGSVFPPKKYLFDL